MATITYELGKTKRDKTRKGSNNIVVFLTNPEYYLPLQHE